MEKQQKSVEMGWVDEKEHVFLMVNLVEIGAELNWSKSDVVIATDELEKFGLAEIADKAEKAEKMASSHCHVCCYDGLTEEMIAL